MFNEDSRGVDRTDERQEDTSAKWVPPAALAGRLIAGAWAALATLCLTAAGLAIELAQDNEPEVISITDILDLVAILPGVVILLVFLDLARVTSSVGLWRSSIAYFAIGWISTVLFRLAELVLPEGWPVLIFAGGAAFVILIVAVVRRPGWFLSTVEPSSPETETEAPPSSLPKDKGAGCSAVSVFMGILLLAKLGSRLAKHGHPADWGVLLAWCLAVVIWLVLAVPAVCFGVAKIRLRDKLGPLACVSGILDFVGAMVLAAFLAGLCILLSEEGESTEQLEWAAKIATGMHDTIYWITIVALFLSLRKRIPPARHVADWWATPDPMS